MLELLVVDCPVSKSHLPVDFEVFDKERRYILTAPVAHPAGGVQFAHIGIDERHARIAFGPEVEHFPVVFPAFLDFVLDASFQEDAVAVFFSHEAKKVAPL